MMIDQLFIEGHVSGQHASRAKLRCTKLRAVCCLSLSPILGGIPEE